MAEEAKKNFNYFKVNNNFYEIYSKTLNLNINQFIQETLHLKGKIYNIDITSPDHTIKYSRNNNQWKEKRTHSDKKAVIELIDICSFETVCIDNGDKGYTVTVKWKNTCQLADEPSHYEIVLKVYYKEFDIQELTSKGKFGVKDLKNTYNASYQVYDSREHYNYRTVNLNSTKNKRIEYRLNDQNSTSSGDQQFFFLTTKDSKQSRRKVIGNELINLNKCEVSVHGVYGAETIAKSQLSLRLLDQKNMRCSKNLTLDGK